MTFEGVYISLYNAADLWEENNYVAKKYQTDNNQSQSRPTPFVQKEFDSGC